MVKKLKGFLITMALILAIIGGSAGGIILLRGNSAEPDFIEFTVNVDCNVEWTGLVQIDDKESSRIEIGGFSDKEYSFKCKEYLIVVVSKVSEERAVLHAVIWRGARIIDQDSTPFSWKGEVLSLSATKWD